MLIEPRQADDPELRALIAAQRRELAEADGDAHIDYPLRDGIEFLVGTLDGQAVSCGALQPLEPGVGEIKRMYVRPDRRGEGLSRKILAALEEHAAHRGYRVLRLETGKAFAVAVGLYTSSGYVQIPLFGEYVDSPISACFEKTL